MLLWYLNHLLIPSLCNDYSQMLQCSSSSSLKINTLEGIQRNRPLVELHLWTLLAFALHLTPLLILPSRRKSKEPWGKRPRITRSNLLLSSKRCCTPVLFLTVCRWLPGSYLFAWPCVGSVLILSSLDHLCLVLNEVIIAGNKCVFSYCDFCPQESKWTRSSLTFYITQTLLHVFLHLLVFMVKSAQKRQIVWIILTIVKIKGKNLEEFSHWSMSNLYLNSTDED